ncbi:MAG TPA: c-type cytochrome [Candidatus Competibacteraceae bacterium]|nr:c-type cytochrome [Candidatus Competibacteraceae bacterium]
MKSPFIAVAALCLVAMSALAADEQKLAQESGCMNCHALDKRMIGPSYKAAATKYKDDPSAETMLIKKVKEGGAGIWGQVAMPPNSPRVSDAVIQTLVKWILAQ